MKPALARGLSLGTVLLLSALSNPAWADPLDDRLLASQCTQCHGTDGNATGDIDSLAGESLRELYEELLEMKYDSDFNEIMHRQARGYSDDQLWRIANFYAGLPGGGSDGGDDD